MDDRPRGVGARKTAQAVAFREAMSRVAETAHVVATDGSAGLAGLTATAFAGVSDQPPTVLVCVQATSRFLPKLDLNGVFCVNTLAASDQALADLFAGRSGVHGAERFAAGVWTTAASGAPLLRNALVAFDCRVEEARPVATHVVVIGEVTALHFGEHVPALVYRNRGYHRL